MSESTIRTLDRLGFQYYDTDNNNSFDVYEVGFVQNPNGDTTHFTLTNRIANFYTFSVAEESPASNDPFLHLTEKSMFYVADTGFLFKTHEADLNAIVYSAHPYGDPSAYGVLTYGLGRTPFPPPFADSIPLLDKTQMNTLSSPTLSQQMKAAFTDKNFLTKLGVKSVEELYQKYDITTEGEVIFSQNAEIKLQDAHPLTGKNPAFAVTYNHGKKPLIIFDDRFLDSIFGNGTPTPQKLNDLLSVLLHEVDHAQHENFNGGIVDPNNFKDDRLKAWFSTIQKTQVMTGVEIMLLYNNNPLYNKFYTSYFEGYTKNNGVASASAVWVHALVESKAYAKQLGEIYKTGKANHSEDFVAGMLQSAVMHFDLALSLTRMSGGKEYVKEILASIIGNEALIADLQAKANELDGELKKDHFAKRLAAFLADQPLPLR